MAVLLLQRKKDGKDCPGRLREGAAFHLDCSAMSMDNFGADPEAEPGSGIAFCADKRFEECLSYLRADPGPGVCHGQTNAGTCSIPVFTRVGDPDPQPAALI